MSNKGADIKTRRIGDAQLGIDPKENVLTHSELDTNLINLVKEDIETGTTSGNTIILKRVGGADDIIIPLPSSETCLSATTGVILDDTSGCNTFLLDLSDGKLMVTPTLVTDWLIYDQNNTYVTSKTSINNLEYEVGYKVTVKSKYSVPAADSTHVRPTTVSSTSTLWENGHVIIAPPPTVSENVETTGFDGYSATYHQTAFTYNATFTGPAKGGGLRVVGDRIVIGDTTPQTASISMSFTPRNVSYWGYLSYSSYPTASSLVSVTQNVILAGTKTGFVSGRGATRSVLTDMADNYWLWYAYPKSYGKLTALRNNTTSTDIGIAGFLNSNSLVFSNGNDYISITNGAGYTMDYYVYVFASTGNKGNAFSKPYNAANTSITVA